MKLGIGLPTYHGNQVRAADVLDWARLADDAGFESLVVHDKPAHDTWDPLAALAVVAPVTRRARLLTGALILPLRDEALVAKQAAVIDLVSGGRLDLGVSVGNRPEDFELMGRELRGRGARFERQLARLVELWADALATRDSGAAAGPAPAQEPHPRLWVGGYAEAATARAIRFGHGYLFGAPPVAMIETRIPGIREAARAAGRAELPIAALAYVLPTEDPTALAEGRRLLERYYGDLGKPFTERVMTGPPAAIVEAIGRYESSGLDVLHLLPVSTSIGVVERLAADVLPAFEGAAA
jgi:alkanesulfonate monooxygenase SsuD/methylene tetrahydromethanopterin reductase-like flavin-dependent oxidoreductase (luciferase family)